MDSTGLISNMTIKDFINESTMQDLIMEIYDYSDRLSEIFDKMDACIDEIPLYYKAKSSTNLVKYYKDLMKNRSTLINNVKSYATDFTKLLEHLSSTDKYLSSIMQTYIDEIKAKGNIKGLELGE